MASSDKQNLQSARKFVNHREHSKIIRILAQQIKTYINWMLKHFELTITDIENLVCKYWL